MKKTLHVAPQNRGGYISISVSGKFVVTYLYPAISTRIDCYFIYQHVLSAEIFYLIIDNFNTRYITVNLFYQAFTNPVAETSSQSVSNY